MSILFIGKRNDPYTDDAADTVGQLFENAVVIRLARGQRLPESVTSWAGDWLVSYLCPQVLPGSLLERASLGAINFHPGPPEYPGIGCTNFAIYNGEKEYGVTCHFMEPQVDSGGIIEVSRLPIYEADTVYTLTRRCYAYQIRLFHEVMHRILAEGGLQPNGLQWQRKAYTSRDFRELYTITPSMSEAEIARRTRAVTFPGYPGPELLLHGKRYVLQELNRPIPTDG